MYGDGEGNSRLVLRPTQENKRTTAIKRTPLSLVWISSLQCVNSRDFGQAGFRHADARGRIADPAQWGLAVVHIDPVVQLLRRHAGRERQLRIAEHPDEQFDVDFPACLTVDVLGPQTREIHKHLLPRLMRLAHAQVQAAGVAPMVPGELAVRQRVLRVGGDVLFPQDHQRHALLLKLRMNVREVRHALAHVVPEYRVEAGVELIDQSFRTARHHGQRVISPSLADRDLLQMDQAAPAHQGVLRHFAQRGEDPSLDRSGGLRADRDRAQTVAQQHQPVRVATDFEHHAIRASHAGMRLGTLRFARWRRPLRQTIDAIRQLTGQY